MNCKDCAKLEMRAVAAEALNAELQEELELLREEVDKLRARDDKKPEEAKAGKAGDELDALLMEGLKGKDSFLQEALRYLKKERFSEMYGGKRDAMTEMEAAAFGYSLPKLRREMYMPIEQKVRVERDAMQGRSQIVLSMRYDRQGDERQNWALPVDRMEGGVPIPLLREASDMLFHKVTGITPPSEISDQLLEIYARELKAKGVRLHG